MIKLWRATFKNICIYIATGILFSLLSSCAHPDIIDASYTGNTDHLISLIAQGADVNVEHDGFTPLHIAVKYGWLNAVNLLIDAGADVHAKGPCFTPLSYAAFNGYIDIMKLLIDKGADINAAAVQCGKEILFLEGDFLEFNKKLSPHRYSPPMIGDTPLISASLNNKIDAMRLLIEKGAKVDTVNLMGHSSLMIHSFFGNKEAVQLLIESGAVIDSRDKDGATPFMYAVSSNKTEIMKTLLSSGADINVRTALGVTSLMRASINGYLAAATLLLAEGADYTIEGGYNGREVSALSLAELFENDEIKKLLLFAGAKK